MTDEKPVEEMTEQEWQEHLSELVNKKVEYEMAQESRAIIGFVGALLMLAAGWGSFGFIFAVIGFLMYIFMIKKFVDGGRYWKLIVSILVSTAIVLFAVVRLI